ncbi:MAG: hypothetical protein K8T26_19690 [Lentisphaerae bacterium]|nr:hypothetical protein [Lentisphaerota bacterium]
MSTYRRIADDKVTFQWWLEYLGGEEWKRVLIVPLGKVGEKCAVDSRRMDDWHATSPHRVMASVNVEANELTRSNADGGPIACALFLRAGMVRRSAVGVYEDPAAGGATLQLDLPAHAMTDDLTIRRSLALMTGERQGLRLWEGPVCSVRTTGSVSMFPIEPRRFQESWKWLEVVLPEESASDETLETEIYSCLRLQIDETKEAWRRFETCWLSDVQAVRENVQEQLNGLILTAIIQWFERMDPSARRDILFGPQSYAHASLGWMLRNLIRDRVGQRPGVSRSALDVFQIGAALQR